MNIQETVDGKFEGKAQKLEINLNSKTFEGDKELLEKLTIENIDQVDTDDASEDSEGNVEGTIRIYLTTHGGWDTVWFTGESFSPLWLRFDTIESQEERKQILDELLEKVSREMI